MPLSQTSCVVEAKAAEDTVILGVIVAAESSSFRLPAVQSLVWE